MTRSSRLATASWTTTTHPLSNAATPTEPRDTSFGGGAPVLVRPPHASSSYTDGVAVAADGKILTAGVGYDPVANSNELAIQRFQGARGPGEQLGAAPERQARRRSRKWCP